MDNLEITLIVGYFILVLIIGFIASRRKTLESFLIADRSLGSINSGLSIIASKIGGGTILVLTAFVYSFGPSAYMYVLGGAVGYFAFLLFARKIKPIADKKKFYSLMDYIKYRFGEKNSLWFGILVFFANLLNYFVQVIGGGKIISSVFELSLPLSIVIMLSAIFIYLSAGGFKAVVYTDALQAVMFIVFLAVITIFFGYNAGPMPEFESMNVSTMVGFFLIGLFLPFSGHELWQRVYATKQKKLVKSLAVGSVGFVIGGAIIVSLGLFIKTILPNIDPDVSIIVAFSTQLTGFLKIAGILSLFAIIMSSADTWMYNCTGILFQDILKINKKRIKKIFFIGFFLFSALAYLSSIIMPSLAEYTLIYGMIYAAIGGLIVFDIIFKFKKKYMSYTYVLITIFTICVLFVSKLRPEFIAIAIFIVPAAYLLSKLKYWISKNKFIYS